MSWNIWLIIICVTIIVWGWIIYEVINAPLMSDDYDGLDEHISTEKNDEDGNSND